MMQNTKCGRAAVAAVLFFCAGLLFGTTCGAGQHKRKSGVIDEVFVYDDGTTDVIATCIVSVENTNATIATAKCLCEATDDGFAFCSTVTDTSTFPGLAIGIGEAFGEAGTSLTGSIITRRKGTNVRINVSATCSLQTELSLEAARGGPSLGHLSGKIAQQAAIFMWPVTGNRPAAEPIQLCARSTEFVFVENGGFANRQLAASSDANSSLHVAEKEDLVFSGGFQWVIENFERKKRIDVGVDFLVIAFVESDALKIYGDGVDAIGGLAAAALGGRALHAVSYKNLRVQNIEHASTQSPPVGQTREP